MRVARLVGLLAVGVLLAVAVVSSSGSASIWPAGRAQFDSPARSNARLRGIHKIRHIVIIMQENRSFDSYFGTYRGADGIPGLASHRGNVPCIPDPGEHCVRPFHDRHNLNAGGPYFWRTVKAQIDRGKMDGFIRAKEATGYKGVPADDVMGYHTAKEIPNYWKYARNFVLDDHMFGSVASWSLPSHLFLVSLWSARCTSTTIPPAAPTRRGCRSALPAREAPPSVRFTPGRI